MMMTKGEVVSFTPTSRLRFSVYLSVTWVSSQAVTEQLTDGAMTFRADDT